MNRHQHRADDRVNLIPGVGRTPESTPSRLVSLGGRV